jgi:DNA-binding NarL/FixJ family response regulator
MEANAMGTHILLALPQNTLRSALKDAYIRSIFTPDICDVASSDELAQQLRTCSWDFVVVHQSLLTDITQLPQGQFVVITDEPDRTVFLACLIHGLRGYLLERTLSNHLLMSLLLVPGVLLIDPALSDWLANCLGNATQESMKNGQLTKSSTRSI